MSTSHADSFDLRQAVSDKRMRGMWKLATGYRWFFGLSLFFVSIAAVAKMLTYLLLAHTVDGILGAGTFEINTLLLAGAGFVGLALIEGSSSFFAGTIVARSAERITRRVRNFLFDHLQRLNFTFYDKNKTGDLIQRASSDVDAVRRFFSEEIIGVGRILLPFIVNVITLMFLHVGLGLLSLVSVPFLIMIAIYFFSRIEKKYALFQEQDEVLYGMLQENLSGVRVVKAFARQDYEIARYDKENKEKFKRGRTLLLQHALFWPSSDVLAWSQMITCMVVGATMAINGQISVGTYLAFIGLVTQIVWPIRNLGRLIVQASTGLVSYTRLAEIFAYEREPLEDAVFQPKGNVQGAVEFKNVAFSYDGDKNVLEDISFSVEPGKVVALLGSTGSGKTTLVNMLPRFYDYTGGRLTLDGVDLKDYSRSFLRGQIGIVEQEPFLFSRSIRENITYGVGREVSDDEVYAAAKAAALHEVILSFPDGYNTIVGEKGVTLSGGQKQRTALARTLLKNPRILILDDATSSVDPETEGEIREALRNLMQDRTTFIIAHRIQSVMIADLILVMDQGKIVQMGTHDELVLQEGGIYKQIYDLQSRIEDELEKEIASVGLS
ncbi:MAG: ABC transporter ATP-binding protein [Anaerolineae bacterium]|nr:ABC transporter ATP-binding protein [Anaerolineae bacterium]